MTQCKIAEWKRVEKASCVCMREKLAENSKNTRSETSSTCVCMCVTRSVREGTKQTIWRWL